ILDTRPLRKLPAEVLLWCEVEERPDGLPATTIWVSAFAGSWRVRARGTGHSLSQSLPGVWTPLTRQIRAMLALTMLSSARCTARCPAPRTAPGAETPGR